MLKFGELATQKQIEYANAIYDMLGAELPNEKTKSAYSAYLDKYAPIYRESCREYSLLAELETEMIDARRDW